MTTMVGNMQECTPNFDGAVTAKEKQARSESEVGNFIRSVLASCGHQRFSGLTIGRTTDGWWDIYVGGSAGANALKLYLPPEVRLSFLPTLLARGCMSISFAEAVIRAAHAQ